MFSILASLALVLLGVSSLFGQTNPTSYGPPVMRSPVHGAITGLPDAHRLLVEIGDPAHHNMIERVAVNPDGSFHFFSPPPEGGFEIRILTDTLEVVHKEWVNAVQASFPVSIQITAVTAKPRPAEGSISAYRLSHRVPHKAMQEFQRADQEYKKHHLNAAIEHLRKAAAADEGFMEAVNNLGSRLMEQNQPAEAAIWFEKAARLDPASAAPILNLSVAMIKLGRAAEAERLARRALAVDHGSVLAQKVLNISLQKQGKPVGVSALR